MSLTPLSPNNFNQGFKEVQTTLDAAFQRGDIGRAGVKSVKSAVPQAESFVREEEDAGSSRQQYKDGTVKTRFSDGRSITQAPNGLIKEEKPNGSLKISLPNGMQIKRNEKGETIAYGSQPGEIFKVGTRQSKTTGQFEFRFADKEGNSYKVYSQDLKMQVSHRGAETEKPSVSQPAQGGAYAGAPHQGGAHQPRNNMGVFPPIFNGPDYGDPYASQMAPNGLIRQQNPDGSIFMSLPHGVVVSEMQDGSCNAFDSRYPGQTFPASAQDVNIPGRGVDREFNYRDGAGNTYTLYSRNQDFAVESADRNVEQLVMADGTIMVLARTQDPQTGAPQKHRVMIDPFGRVNTYGEKGMAVGKDRLVVKNGDQAQSLNLPYPIPSYQHLIGQMYPANPRPCPHQCSYPEGFAPQAGTGCTQNCNSGQNTGVNQSQPPMHKGIWGKFKEFLGLDSGNEQAQQMMKNSNQAYGCGQAQCNSCDPSDPYGYMKDSQKMMKGTMLLTGGMTVLTMLSTLPMMFFGFPHMMGMF